MALKVYDKLSWIKGNIELCSVEVCRLLKVLMAYASYFLVVYLTQPQSWSLSQIMTEQQKRWCMGRYK